MDTPAWKKNARNQMVSLFNGFTDGLPAFRWFVCLLGFSTGLALTAQGQVPLPYATGFASTGFTPGPLNGQHSWIVLGGSADITTTVSDLGTQSVVLAAGSPAAMIGLPFASPSPAQPVIYVDCLIKPVAGTVASSLINLDTSLVALRRNGSYGQIFAYDGAKWIATSAVFALNSNGTSLDWMRLTFRLDFAAKTWDLYFDETLAAHSVAFTHKSAASLPFFIFQGDPTLPSYLNYLTVGSVNPLPAAAPVFSPAPGSYASAQMVTITSAIPGATIHYTTDGSTPTETNGTLYSGPVAIGSTTPLKAMAYETGFAADSPVSSGIYTVLNSPATVLNVLYNFTAANHGGTIAEGAVQGSDGNFYGTTTYGGSSADGTVFKMTPAGVLTTLVSFNGTNGANPQTGVLQGSDGNFYGTTLTGGSSEYGVIFKMTAAGVLTTLVSINDANGSAPGRLVQGSDGNFYSTTSWGGDNNNGSIFKITPAGVLTTLVSFNDANGSDPIALVQGSDGNFYGTTEFGGGSGKEGTVFKMTPAGVLTTLVSFIKFSNEYDPVALVQGSDGNFYGTTYAGGSGDNGTIFKMTPAGGLTTLASFNGNNGSGPNALVQGSDGNFHGTAIYGGTGIDNLGRGFGGGVFFQLIVPPGQ